jgi:hypothetical protein
MKSGVIRRLALAVVTLLAAVIGFYCCWQARIEGQVDLSRKMIGRWAAEGRADNLVAGAPAVVSSEVTRVQGRVGRALLFNGGTGKVIVPGGPELAFRAGQDFSVMAWIQPMRAETSFGVMSIVEKRKVGGILTARGYSLHLEDGRLSCQLAPGTGLQITRADLFAPKRWIALWKNRKALAPASRFVSSAPDLGDGRCHHVALTLDWHSRTGGKLYVDGKVVQTFDPTELRGSLANSEPLLIGTHPDPTLHCGFKGLIEDVRLDSRTVSQAEIEAAAKQ